MHKLFYPDCNALPFRYLRSNKFLSLLTLLLFYTGYAATGQVWTAAGPADNNWPTYYPANWPSITNDGAGNIYMAFPTETSKLSVRKWDGTSWTYVGPPNITTNTISNPHIRTDAAGIPYVIYTGGGSNGQAAVKKFVNGAWTDVGAATISVSTAGNCKLAFSSTGDVYAAYFDNANQGRLTVRKFSNGAWTDVGPQGFTTASVYYFDFGISPSDIPYVVFRDESLGNKTTVKMYNGSWTTVGTAGFSASGIWDPSITFDASGNPVVAYSDYAAGQSTVVKTFDGIGWTNLGSLPSTVWGYCDYNRIMKVGSSIYLLFKHYGSGNKPNVIKYSNNSWSQVGTSYFSTNGIYAADMTVTPSEVPFVAFTDNALSGRLSVQKMTAGSWSYVGTPGISLGTATNNCLGTDTAGHLFAAFIETAASYTPSIKKLVNNNWVMVDSLATGYNAGFLNLAFGKADTFYLTYQDYLSSKIKTKRYHASTGSASLTLPDASPGSTSSAFLALDTAKNPVVAYCDNTNSGALTVRKFSSGSWATVGAAITQFSVNQVSFRIGKNNVPYIAYTDGNFGYAPVVKKFDGVNWVYAGTMPLSSGQTNTQCLEIDSTGTPYLAFFDGANNGKITVKKLSGSTWMTVGTAGFSQGAAYHINLTIDKYGYLYVAYMDVGQLDQLVVKRFDGTSWVDAGSATLSSGRATDVKLFNDKKNNNAFVIYSQGQDYVKQANLTLCTPASLSFSKTDVSCNGLSNGAIDLSASGGTGPFSYAWTGPNGFAAIAQDIVNIPAGTYHIIASTSAYGGCSSNLDIVITQPGSLTATATNDAPCPGNSLQFAGSGGGGTAPYNYSWTGPGAYNSNNPNPVIPTATSTVNGSYVLTITDGHSCVAADTTDVAILPAPTTQASGLSITAVTTTSAKLSFTRGNGNKGAIVVVSEGAPLNTSPLCGNSYTAPFATNIFFNADSLFSVVGNGKVVYKVQTASPAIKTFTLKNLLPGTRYYFSIFEYDSSAAGTVYLTSPALTSDTITQVAPPTVNAGYLRFDNLTPYSCRITWTNGNGSKRIVAMKATGIINAAPYDSVIYNAGSAFGAGDTLTALSYTGTHYIVYNGADSTVTVSNLQAGVKYNLAVFEYNGYGNVLNYASTSLKGSVTTPADFIAVSTAGIPQPQNFDSLSATNNILPLGWHAASQPATDNGSSATAGIKNYGQINNGDRALGSLGNGSFGVKLVNKGSVAWTSILIKYTGEQWRKGGGGMPDSLTVQYTKDAYTLTGAAKYMSSAPVVWNNAPAILTFLSPQTSAGATNLNGNAAANKTLKLASITGIAINPGEAIWVRWSDGSAAVDDGLGIDDVEIVPFTNTITANDTITGSLLNDLNITGGTGLINPAAGKLTIKNALNIESGAVLDLGNTVAPSLTISGWQYGTGRIKAPLSNDAKLTAGGAGINHSLYFLPAFNTVNSLTILGNTIVTLGNTLQIAATPKAGVVKVGTSATDAVLNSNGNLVLKSDTLGTAMIDDVFGSVNGNVTVERAFQHRAAIRLVSHPFSSALTLSSVGGYLPSLNNLWYYNISTASPNGISGLANNSSWTSYSSMGATVTPFDVLRIMKDATPGATMSMTGPVNQGAVAVNVTAGTDSFVLVGNPYPASLLLGNALASAGPGFISSAIYTWDPTKSTAGAFIAVPNTKFATAKLPICGAFVAIVIPGASASFQFTEADKTITGNTKSSFKPKEMEGLQLVVSRDGTYYDGTYVYFDTDAAPAAERSLDAPKISNPGLNFYTESADGKHLSVDVRPFAERQLIPIGLENAEAGDYTITAAELTLSAERIIFLVDTYTGIETLLDGRTSYAFKTNRDTGKGGGRFYLRMGSARQRQQSEGFSFDLVPNPAKDLVSVRLKGQSVMGAIRVVSITGQVMLNYALESENQKEYQLSLSSLPAGIYMVEITGNGEKASKRLVKQ